MKARRAIVMKRNDNVATALENIEVGDRIDAKLNQDVTVLRAKERIPFGFKVALTDISKGKPVLKYGEIIGWATDDIGEGFLVHVHNVEGTRGRGELSK